MVSDVSLGHDTKQFAKLLDVRPFMRIYVADAVITMTIRLTKKTPKLIRNNAYNGQVVNFMFITIGQIN